MSTVDAGHSSQRLNMNERDQFLQLFRKMHPTTCAAIEQAAIQAERERCAKIAESYSQFAYYPKAIAKAIRGGEHDVLR